MNVKRSLILFFTLFVSMSSIAMECGLCLQPICEENKNMPMCPNETCVQAHPTCKECWQNYFKADKCVYKCKSTAQCVVCNKNLIENDTIISKRFCSLDCSHFICYTCIADKNEYACAICNKNHNAAAIKKIKAPRNFGEAKKFLQTYLEKTKAQKKVIRPIVPSIKADSCPVCHQNKPSEKLLSLGCTNNHRYCTDCLPNLLHWYDTCQMCNQNINHNKAHVWNQLTQIYNMPNTCSYCSSQGTRFAQLNNCVHKACVHCLPAILNTQQCSRCMHNRVLGVSEQIKLKDDLARLNGAYIVPSQREFMRTAGMVGLSFLVVPWIVHHWSKYRLQSTLQALKSAAQSKTTILLSFEFDSDDTAFLGLQDSFDIAAMLQSISSEEKRIALQTAIEQYDMVFRKAYDRIITTYYYQPAVNFEQKEQQLVKDLKACAEQVSIAITECTQELGSPMRNVLLGVGFGLLSGLGIANITKG